MRPHLLPAVAIAFGVVSVPIVLGTNVATTHASLSVRATALDLIAGLGLIAAGVLARERRPIGALTMLIGVAWLAADWVGWATGPGFARSAALVVAPFLLPLIVHLMLAGVMTSRVARSAVVLAYAVTAVISVGLAAVRDPFLDPDCWSNCTVNDFLVHADAGLARLLEDVWLRFSLASWPLVAVCACWLLVRASGPARGATWSVLVPTALVAAAETAHLIVLLGDPLEDPRRDAFEAIFDARAAAYIALAAGVTWTVARARSTRAAISRLAADLGEMPEPGSLRAVLASALGDPGLEVAYPQPGPRRYVDAEGHPVDLGHANRRATTAIVRNGEPVAIVVHDAALTEASELERRVGAAARLAVDNERLRAGVLAQLEDLRASRARIVEAGDTARRRIERDLHDGAQQRLLAASFELRLARAAADAGGETDAAAVLATSCDRVQAALSELRDLAHGIYPAILTEAGLGPALETLADDAPLPVEIRELPDERFPEAVERAAYIAVSEAVAGAAAEYVEVGVHRAGEVLVVDLGPIEAPLSVQAADRVGALGGTTSLQHGRLRVEIPCA